MLVCFYLAACSCSILHETSEGCDPDGGQTTLQSAGMESEGLTIIENCFESHTGVLPSETRTVVASGSWDAVTAALETGGVDSMEASSFIDDALRGPESFAVVAVTPRGAKRQQGDRLTYRDVLEGQDLRYRYVAWGKPTDRDQYLLMIRLSTEIS